MIKWLNNIQILKLIKCKNWS